MAFRGDFQPSERAFVHHIGVVASDIDDLGHANNVVWVRWVNEAAIAHSEALGLGRAGLAPLSVLWLVRRHDIEYLLPALEGEALEAITWAHTLSGATSLRRTLFKRGEQVVARAETTWVMVNAMTQRACRVPQQILTVFGF